MKNSILFNFTKRSLSANKTRTAVSIIGVLLSTALICAVFTTVTSIHAAMLKRTIATEGSWSAMAQHVDPKKVDALVASEHTKAAATSTVLGTTQLSGDAYTRSDNGTFQIRTLPQQLKGTADAANSLTITPAIKTGAYPTQTNELALPERYRDVHFTDANLWSDEKITVGSTIHVNLSDSTSNADNTAGDTATNTQTHSYTVSGFYETAIPFYGNSLIASDNQLVALASSNSANYTTKGRGMAWFELTGFSTQDELTSFVESTLGTTNTDSADDAADGTSHDAHADTADITRTIFHTNLMRYQALRGRSVNWDALWNFGLFLAGIISVASIVLIYNSFAISVAERTRQFGLLSSLGASKKQMRRCVYVESLLIGLIGIPLGIAAGICGVAVTLQVAKQGFAVLLNSSGSETVTLSVSGFALALTVAFELAVLLIGAAVPALRAGMQSPMSAIRQTADIKMNRRLTRKITSKTRSLYARFAGVAGTLSSRNLSRSSSRGTTIVVSLAISVTLIVITGSFIRTLLPLIEAQNSYSDADLVINLYSNKKQSALESAKTLERIDSTIAGLTRQESDLTFQVPASMDASSLTDAMRAYLTSTSYTDIPPSDYSYYNKDSNTFVSALSVHVPSQATWDKLAQKYTVDKAQGALVLNSLVTTIDEKRQLLEPFNALNNMQLYTWSSDNSLYLLLNAAGQIVVPLYPDEQPSAGKDGTDQAQATNSTATEPSSADAHTTTEPNYVPLDSLGDKITKHTITSIAHVKNLKSEAPYLAQESSSNLVMYMAPELAQKIMASSNEFKNPIIYVYYTAQNSAKATEALTDALNAAGLNNDVYEGSYKIFDLSTYRRNNQLVTQTMLLFLLLFTGIMVLIAIANVFNTLCNSMMLRTREFAVLRSIGMDEKQFNRMVFCECLSYALRGLAVGAVISIGAFWLFWKFVLKTADLSSMGSNFTTFELPLSSLLDASICVVVVLILSVIYALHKTRSTNVVEVLRNEVI